jgi:hypothetical protein
MEEKSGNFLESGYGITYMGSSVAPEGAVINLEVAALDKNSSSLSVPCGPPGIGAKKFQENV